MLKYQYLKHFGKYQSGWLVVGLYHLVSVYLSSDEHCISATNQYKTSEIFQEVKVDSLEAENKLATVDRSYPKFSNINLLNILANKFCIQGLSH